MFERRVIDDVRHRTDIVEIIGEHVPLKKDQSNYGDVYTNLWDVDHPIKEFVD